MMDQNCYGYGLELNSPTALAYDILPFCYDEKGKKIQEAHQKKTLKDLSILSLAVKMNDKT